MADQPSSETDSTERGLERTYKFVFPALLPKYNIRDKMPNEYKKRGRREALKRARQENEVENLESKKPKNEDTSTAFVQEPDSQPVFFGFLNEQEQQYFKEVDVVLETNQFETSEEKSVFLNNIHLELEGKAMKVASSQSCSRVFEKVVSLSTLGQVTRLLEQFKDQYIK